jgi:hypothetical protein
MYLDPHFESHFFTSIEFSSDCSNGEHDRSYSLARFSFRRSFIWLRCFIVFILSTRSLVSERFSFWVCFWSLRRKFDCGGCFPLNGEFGRGEISGIWFRETSSLKLFEVEGRREHSPELAGRDAVPPPVVNSESIDLRTC